MQQEVQRNKCGPGLYPQCRPRQVHAVEGRRPTCLAATLCVRSSSHMAGMLTSVSLNICRRSLSTITQSGAMSTPACRSGHLQRQRGQRQEQQAHKTT